MPGSPCWPGWWKQRMGLCARETFSLLFTILFNAVQFEITLYPEITGILVPGRFPPSSGLDKSWPFYKSHLGVLEPCSIFSKFRPLVRDLVSRVRVPQGLLESVWRRVSCYRRVEAAQGSWILACGARPSLGGGRVFRGISAAAVSSDRLGD